MGGKTAAIIVAGGKGVRAGGGMPKQYRALAGRPLLAWTIDAFATHPEVDVTRVVIGANDRADYDAAVSHVSKSVQLLEPVIGGSERQDSVRSGLESLIDDAPQRVLIHDAARPFISASVISDVLGALERGPAAIAALPVADTLKRSDGAATPHITETVSRDALWRAQTPQGFGFDAILAAHRDAAGEVLTDDAAVAERAGLPVVLVPGSPDNMKITQAEDFGMAEILLARAHGGLTLETRTGQGFDVHAFAPGDFVTLCGVEVPHDRALAGHSDADVGMHALTDAILGAIAAGDIGDHFPPTDPQWKGAPSRLFLAKARDLVAELGGAIAHADITLICERPKVGPHREAMRAALAEILDINASRVSVKATTTEKLGFAGRREGIAAMATATVRLPESVG